MYLLQAVFLVFAKVSRIACAAWLTAAFGYHGVRRLVGIFVVSHRSQSLLKQ